MSSPSVRSRNTIEPTTSRVSTVIKKGINLLSTGDGSFTCFPTRRPVGRPFVCCASQIQIAFPCSVVKKGSRRLHGSVVSEITHSLEFQAANSKTYASALDKAARMLLLKHFHEPISVPSSFFLHKNKFTIKTSTLCVAHENSAASGGGKRISSKS